MHLNKEEYRQYMRLQPSVLYYVGQQQKILPSKMSFEEFMATPRNDKLPTREALYDNIHLLEKYIKENAAVLSEEDQSIIRNFKHFKKERFFVVKQTNKYAFFLGEKHVYAVHALNDPFQTFWGDNLPVMIETVLLPFKNKIVYDGILFGSNIHFGKGIRESIKNNLNIAEGRYGLITSLPVKIDASVLQNSSERELLAMMKTKSSREQNWYKIQDLIEEHPNLNAVYMKEWGRINTRAKKKELKSLGVKKRWFGIYNDTILASGNNEKEVYKQISAMLSEQGDLEAVFYFKV